LGDVLTTPHCILDSILYAKENAITLVTFPPSCSHRLQPLGVGVMRPFKGKLHVSQHDWMNANTGKVISVLNLASLKYAVYEASYSAKNLIAAFAKNCIWQFHDLPSVARRLCHYLLRLWKNKFVTKRSLFLFLGAL
jgi:phenylpropionate dioxygenase-like ring-hydroxylating dioxygenase large terminal subunit